MRGSRDDVKPTRFRQKNGKVPFNASGVAQVGPRRFAFIDNEDPTAFFEFELDDDDLLVESIRRRPLAGVGDAWWSDLEGLARVDADGETYLIAASSLSTRGGSHPAHDGLLRVRYTPEGDLHTEAMIGFRDWLLAHEPALAVIGEFRPDAGGLNVEGLAWDPCRRALLLGRRGPTGPGHVSVINIPVEINGTPWSTELLSTPTLVQVAIPDLSTTVGVRDIAYDERTQEFLVLLGRSISGGHEPFRLCSWNGSADEVGPIDVAFHRTMKPEGLTTFTSEGSKILIVDDRGGYAVIEDDRA